jgi:hypothetical protein
MTDQPNQPPIPELPPDAPEEQPPVAVDEQPAPPETPASRENGEQHVPEETPEETHARLERLGGEPAPDITPEEFARLQQSGQIHIDPRGRVRSRQINPDDAGISLRKRRAWYGSVLAR